MWFGRILLYGFDVGFWIVFGVGWIVLSWLLCGCVNC